MNIISLTSRGIAAVEKISMELLKISESEIMCFLGKIIVLIIHFDLMRSFVPGFESSDLQLYFLLKAIENELFYFTSFEQSITTITGLM